MPDDLSEIEIALLREERVGETVAAIERVFPTGWTEFDVAWIEVLRGRPHTAPCDCPTIRIIVGRHLDRLDELLAAKAALSA